MRKIFLLFSFLLILPIVYGGSTTILTENFDYDDNYENHNWDRQGIQCLTQNGSLTPINSFFTTNSFGFNDTNSCGIGNQNRIQRNISVLGFDDGSLTLTFDMMLKNDSVQLNDMFTVVFASKNWGATKGMNFVIGRVNNNLNYSYVTECLSGWSGCEVCNWTDFNDGASTIEDIEDLQNHSINMEHTISLDLTNSKYSWFINGSQGTSDCINKNLGTFVDVQQLHLLGFSDTAEFFQGYLDNILITTDNVSLVVFPVSSPCTEDSECLTKNCQNGYCQGKVGGISCVNDIECISGNCLNEKCTKPSLWKLVDASKTEIAGDDTDTNNFISLLFIIGIPLIFIFVAGTGGILPALAVLYILAIFFTIVGWLSVFLLVGFIITGLLVFVFISMMGRGSD